MLAYPFSAETARLSDLVTLRLGFSSSIISIHAITLIFHVTPCMWRVALRIVVDEGNAVRLILIRVEMT
jgi:uncharacterized RDD family membrane protein YckC